MAIHIQPAQFPKGEVADVQNYPPAAAAVFLLGAPITIASAEATEAASPVAGANLAGFVLNGTVAAGVSSSPAGTVGVAKAKNSQIYLGQVTDAAANAVLTNLSGISVGDVVGCVKSTNAALLNEWVFLTGGTGFVVTKIDDNLDIIWVFAQAAILDPLV